MDPSRRKEDSMSLDFRLTAIEGWETLCRKEDGSLNPVTENLIFATMSVGLGEITEKNHVEFYLRLGVADSLSQWPGRRTHIKLEDVKAHIGLVTNVSDESITKWFKCHMDSAKREIEYRARRDAQVEEPA
jgi:hypothetical protein